MEDDDQELPPLDLLVNIWELICEIAVFLDLPFEEQWNCQTRAQILQGEIVVHNCINGHDCNRSHSLEHQGTAD